MASLPPTLSLPGRRTLGQRVEAPIPSILRPLIRAYALGYASAVAPRLLTLLLQYVSCRRRQKSMTSASGDGSKRSSPIPGDSFQAALKSILRRGLGWQAFPAFCAVLVGGSTLLEIPVKRLIDRLAVSLKEVHKRRLSRWLATFVSAWLSLQLLQSKRSLAFTEIVPVPSDHPPGVVAETRHFAGRTLDLSLFAAARALDVLVGELWSRRRARRIATKQWTGVETAISRLTDPTIFAASSALIMWTWIYLPSRLPRAYNKWIGSAAAVDGRLLTALRECRTGELRYGEDTGHAPLLQAMCADYSWPLEWGDPAKSIPFPCDMVHMGCGPSCEYHALSRFGRSFTWAMATYLPLNLMLVARRPNAKGVVRAILSAARSSAFLGTFITLFYYGVCLARSRIGPRLLGQDKAACQSIDGGLCAGSGCVLCGWSILLENPGRRKDIALFVAPRAMATLLPRRYSLAKQWRETFVFAFSTAIVFTCVLENRKRVRGVLGNVLASVLDA